ncbi:MAG: outer membrane beta-barrel protein [Alloprevotella sp.]|nr:outer membrane beta-barrel protein [Alloprevotella sp.]
MRRFFLLFFSFALAFGLQAQKYKVSGHVEDSRTQQNLQFVNALLLQSADSMVVENVMTDSLGNFTIATAKAGNYLVRLSYVGFEPTTRFVAFNEQTTSVDLGVIGLTAEANTLSTAVVTATAARVQQVGDTTQFNASAYRTPEGSTLEALVKQIPGAEVSESGGITINGKTIDKLLVNGKDFFKGDNSIAMKNLPVDLVSQLKTYEKKSDYAEMTGVDDGEESQVLDIITKRQLNESWVVNVDVAGGTHDRYAGRVFATRFTDHMRATVFGSMNNTAERGFGGPRGFGGQQGLTTVKRAGFDFNWENGKRTVEGGYLEVGASLFFTHRNNNLLSISSSETFLTSGATGSFSNNRTPSLSSSTNVWANAKLQWNPDSLTQITMRPTFSHSDSHNSSTSQAATFNEDPYSISGMESPLDSLLNPRTPQAELEAIAVNRTIRESLSSSNSNSVGGELNVVRTLNNKGRNISLRADGNYSKGHSGSYSISDIHYYSNGQSSFLNQYTWTPNKNYNYGVRLGYVEPLGKNWFAEARYNFSFRYQDSDRSLYNLHEITTGGWDDPINHPVIGSLPTEAEVLQQVRDDYNSQYATYKYYNNSMYVGVRYNTRDINFNAGVSFNPQRTKMAYERPGQDIDTIITRNVFNISPQIRLRYKFSPTSNLDIRYRGSSSQPSMTNLLDVVDDSDPLNVSMGNPGLKPSWNNNLWANYYGYQPERQAGMMVGFNFSNTQNAVSTRIIYDDATGVRYSRPENINGNWNMGSMFMYNFGFGKNKLWTLSTFTRLSFNHSVGYVSRYSSSAYTRTAIRNYFLTPVVKSEHNADYYRDLFNQSETNKNVAKTFGLNENLNLNYRAKWFDVGATGTLNYQHAKNSVQTSGNLDTWQFSYGLTANASTPWGMEFSTDIRMSSRRGYSESAMNTNELLWNAQISQTFLKDRSLTVSLQYYDILHQQSNVSRTLNAQLRQDTWTNAINSYCMLHVIYRLNIFGGKKNSEGSQQPQQGPGQRRGGWGGGPGGFGGGGWGGGRRF